MKYICTAKKARETDANAIQNYHIPSMVLMEHAAMECVKLIQCKKKNVILCGPGNNGGDGLAIARLLHQNHIESYIYISSDHLSIDEQIQYDILESLNVEIHSDFNEVLEKITEADIIIDCLFGNGLSRNIEGKYAQLIEAINQSKAYIYAIDVPSGLDATTGNILGTAVQANETIALDCFKEGHFVNQGQKVCGTIHCVDIAIPYELHSDDIQYVDTNLIKNILPKRSPFSHKGTYGKALMIGGSQAMHGAITFAAKSCYHSGIGTLTLFIPDCINDILSTKMDCAMHICAPNQQGYFDESSIDLLKQNINSFNVISIGNGMGRSKVSQELVKVCLKSNLPVIVDADAFWAIQENEDLLNRQAPTILTPHVKELSYILKRSVKDIATNPIQAAKDFSKQYPNCTLILKSDITLISKGNQQYLYSKPNSALAKGGSGDILCGIVTGLYGQCKDSLQASLCAVYIHSHAAQTKKDPACVQPEDIIERINDVFIELRKSH